MISSWSTATGDIDCRSGGHDVTLNHAHSFLNITNVIHDFPMIDKYANMQGDQKQYNSDRDGDIDKF